MKRSVHSYTGELCVIASAVLFGLMPLLVKVVTSHGGNSYMTALGRFFFGSLMLLAVIIIRRDISLHITLRQFREITLLAAVTGYWAAPSDAAAWGGTVLLAFLLTALALVLFQMGLFRCGPIRASLLSTFEPLTSIVVGSFVFYEMLTVQNMIGILCVLGSGVMLVMPASLPEDA